MRQKFFRALFGLGMLSLVVSTVILSYLFYNNWKDDFRTVLYTEGKIIASTGTLTPDRLAAITKATNNTLRITWISYEGKVLYDSSHDAETMDNHLQRPEIAQAILNGEGSDIRDSATLHSISYYEALRLPDNSILRVSRNGSTVYKVIFDAAPGLLALFVLMSGGCYLLARRWTADAIYPIEEIVKAWTSHGDTKPVIDEAYNEITPLLSRLSFQKNELEAMIVRLQAEKNTLRSIMEEMAEGLLLAELDGTIITYNEHLKEFLNHKAELHGESLLLLSDDVDWRKHVINAMRKHQGGEYLLHKDNQHFRIVFHITEDDRYKGRLLIIISDITQSYLEQQRRHEFTSNVSHELKTPLTTISGYAEILAKGMYPNKEEATVLGGHIHTAARHMQELIDTILKLSRIEDGVSAVTFEKTSLRSVVNSAWQQLTTKRQGKNITLAMTGDSPTLEISSKLIEEVFINLFDNAIKFSQGIDNHITVHMCPKDGFTVVSVSDEGVGIPKDKQSRIFERFYQADPSRNSKREGSGLGLALVKHIMEIHSGSVSVKSEPGEGTTFILRFKNSNNA
ncbi:cell wall metabolism sensor histidine kinase WalK [Veillonella sp. R32]|uniref:sensor histidine kinase n=1 Tax=Veillonella sp. R32 TaxID=2021312 RepID=UPI00138A0EA8|nr:ATP-binding protein [Veillonella sp. R32]KAF1683119.1 hypothetical protein VER_03270 [Veillonella sp. R32]